MTDISYVYEPDEIKALVPIEVAAADAGIMFGEDGRALCPFHDDRNNPNLELMPPGEDGFSWAFCRACGAAVDCIEIVRRARGMEFYEALLHLSKLAYELPDDVRSAGSRRRTAVLVPDESWESRLVECQDRARQHSDVGLLSYAYGFVIDDTSQLERAAWDAHLIDWGWGLDEVANVIIPHRDASGALTAVKVRYRDDSWRTFGSLKHLYGSWRRSSGRLAILCEGESDAVWASKENASDIDALALSAGAISMQDEWIAQLSRYEIVYLGMDEDDAGRKAVEKWTEAMSNEQPSLRRIVLPDGEDLRSSGLKLSDVLRDASEVT